MKFKISDFSDFISNKFGGGKDKEYEQAVTQMVEAIKRQRTLYTKEIRDWKLAKLRPSIQYSHDENHRSIFMKTYSKTLSFW